MISQPKNHVRNRLRIATHEMHQGLHAHPLLARLQAPELTYAELKATAIVSCAAIKVVEAERQRRNIWPELSLFEHLDTLCQQLGQQNEAESSAEAVKFENDAELLGALYVVHGSALGGAMLAKAIRVVLPHTPTSFFVPQNASTWQYLCCMLEALPDTDVYRCENGAVRLFEYYRQLADFHMQSLSVNAQL